MMQWKNFLFAALVLSLTLFFVAKISARGEPVVLRTNLENLPMHLAGYMGVEDKFSQEVYKTLQADFHLYRHYRSSRTEELSLYIGYYGTAKGGRTGHNPYACLPGSGWGIVERGKIVLKPSYQPQGVQLNYVVAKKEDVYNVMLHWYQSAGTKVLATGLQQNLQRFQGRLFYNRNDGAYLQVSSIVDGNNLSMSKDKLMIFALNVLELLPKYWPEESDKKPEAITKK